MKKKTHSNERVLAIDPMSRGFAWVVLEGPDRPLDWSTADVREEKTKETLRRVAELLETYEPDVVVLEDPRGFGSRRRARVARLLDSIRNLVQSSGVRVWTCPMATVKAVFSQWEAGTKEEIADEVACRYPALALRRPPLRKIWMPEDPRINLFDAAAFALTYFETRARRRGSKRGQSAA